MSNGSIENNNHNPLRKIQTTISRTFSGREANGRQNIQLVGFHNESFQSDEGGIKSGNSEDVERNKACSSNTGLQFNFSLFSPCCSFYSSSFFNIFSFLFFLQLLLCILLHSPLLPFFSYFFYYSLLFLLFPFNISSHKFLLVTFSVKFPAMK